MYQNYDTKAYRGVKVTRNIQKFNSRLKNEVSFTLWLFMSQGKSPSYLLGRKVSVGSRAGMNVTAKRINVVLPGIKWRSSAHNHPHRTILEGQCSSSLARLPSVITFRSLVSERSWKRTYEYRTYWYGACRSIVILHTHEGLVAPSRSYEFIARTTVHIDEGKTDASICKKINVYWRQLQQWNMCGLCWVSTYHFEKSRV